jgi:hypothetical protein
MLILELRMKFTEGQRYLDSLYADLTIKNGGQDQYVILLESDKTLSSDLNEKGFYGFKKKILDYHLRDNQVLLTAFNELEWEDYSYE